MKQKSAFRVFLSIFTVLSLILSACSPADENHGEDFKEMIKNDSKFSVSPLAMILMTTQIRV